MNVKKDELFGFRSIMNDKKNKIAVILSGFMDKYKDILFELFAANNIELDLYTSNRDLKEHKNVSRIIHVDLKVNLKDLSSIKKLDKELKEIIEPEKYDYVLSDCLPLTFVSNVFHSPSIVQRMKNSPNFIYRWIFYFGHYKLINYFKSFNKQQNKTFVVSNLMKEDFSVNCNIQKENIKVLYPGFETPVEIKRNAVKTNNGAKHFVIGLSAVGFVTKGGFILLDAIRRIKKTYPNVKTKIIYPSYKNNIGLNLYIKFFGLKNNVELLGYQKNIMEFYNSIDCLVVPSLFEPFGRVVTEAMVFGIPVIVGSKTGAKDIIKDEENGFIFDMQKNPGKNLAKTIKLVMQLFEQNTMEKIVL